MVKQYFQNLRALPARLNLQENGVKLISVAKDQLYQLLDETKGVREKMKDLAKTNYDLGIHHMQEGNLYDASLRFGMVVFLRPDHYWAHYQHGRCQIARGKAEEGRQSLLKALKLKPDFLEAQYMMATVDSSVSPKLIPLSIIEEHFDQMAARYNEIYLGERDYRGHVVLVNLLQTVMGEGGNTQEKEVLDLGCGTGLCGATLKERQRISRMVGVDISKRMLDEARVLKSEGRPTYQLFHAADITAYLQACQEHYDVVTAALSLNYTGDLLPVLQAVKKVLKPGGFFAFSVEKAGDGEFQLASDLTHFNHSRAYLSQVLQQAGFSERAAEEVTLYAGAEGWQVVATTAA